MHSQRKGLKKVSGQTYVSCFRGVSGEVSAQQGSTLVSVLVRCLPYGPVGRFALHLGVYLPTINQSTGGSRKPLHKVKSKVMFTM